MKALTVRLLLSAVLLVFILSDCTENGGSIYYILEHEKKQPSSTIGKYLTISDVAKIDTEYYAAAGAIFVGSTTSGVLTWIPKQKLQLPTSDALCNALAAFPPGPSANLFGGFITPSKNLGLYKAVGDDFTGATAVTDALVYGHQIIRLIVSNNVLLIVSATDGPSEDTPFYYHLTYTTDGTSYTRLLTDINVRINDAAFDGTNYWAVAGNLVYSGTTFPLIGTSVLAINTGTYNIKSNNVLQGIFSDIPSNKIYMSMKKDGLFIYNGAIWEHIDNDDQGGSDVSYQGIQILPSGTVIVGSNGYGLYYYVTGFTELKRSDDSDMITLDLYDSSITRFLVDTTENIVLACTNGKGLWRGTIDSSNDAGVSGWEIQ